ncbi:MAG: radical SAM protein [Candidatus Omnitrophica bacterium]|nr:radical SAM protein [Candidatus Omnitrophota bacterium]
MNMCHTNGITRFEFAKHEIEETMRAKRLLSLEIEFSLRCNLRCPYCYVPSKEHLENELSSEEIRDCILQARDLGARKIIILGGEPMMHPGFMEHIAFIRDNGLGVELFTNGYYITGENAKELFEMGVNVVLKMNTFNEELQDKLTGARGSSLFMRRALDFLREAGYPDDKSFLAVSTVICRDNIDELLPMWEWLRDRNILPYFEIITPQGNARQNDWLVPDMGKIKKLFFDIAELDRKRYGNHWEPQPPLVGGRCLRHCFSCLVTSQGLVMPCVGVNIPIGNIRERKLKDILAESEVLQDLRDYRRTIKGPCRSCDKSLDCYGCRGAAYQLTGDYLASDPLCWENSSCRDKIGYLPRPVDEIVPQKEPMRIVQTLEKIGERSAEITVEVKNGMPFVDDKGMLDEAAFLEMIAQATAAMGGFKQYGAGNKKPEGFLLGARRFQVFSPARVGDVLKVSVFKEAKYGDFGIIKGSVRGNGRVLAQGEIKIWHNMAEEETRE